MGSQFFWFLDLLTLAVFAVYIFRGAQKGAVGVIISAAAAIVAVIAAITLSGPISEGIYDNLIKEKVGAHIDTSVSSVIENGTGRERRKIDMSKAKLDGEYLSEITPEFDSSGKAKLDLSSVDLSETGAEPDDLSSFGLDKDIDLTDLRAGIVTMTKED